MSQCKLCLEDKKLRRSHIYPEFLFRPLYDENHKYYSLTTDLNKYIKRPSKGIYQELLCGDCEGQLSKYESYAGEVISSKFSESIRKKSRIIMIDGIDYKKYKLFQMSILWRASIHSRPEIPVLKLGRHQEVLRSMLIKEEPGEEYEYGVIHILIDLPKGIENDFLFPLESAGRKLDNHFLYRGIISGLSWSFIVSNHTSTFELKDIFLKKSGELIIIRDHGSGRKFVDRLMKGFASHPKFPKR